MEKPSLLTDETDRIRSGAILTASRRDTARDIGLNASQVFPPTTPISVNSFRSTSDRARPLSRIAGSTVLDLRSTRPIPQESINNFDVEKGLANEGISTKDGESYKSESKSSGDNALAGDDTASREKKEKQKLPFKHRIKRGTFRFWLHTKNAITHSWLNLLLVFVPIGLASEFAHLSPSIIFAMNSVAIIPLAGLLTMATESVAGRLGDTWGALLNVSFGNAVELIIFIIALVKNEIRIVQAALLGSILANMLLILGMAFLLGGLRYREQIYNSTITQLSSCLLSLSVMSLLLPTAFHASFEDNRVADRATLKISRGTSVVG
jgi:Ca2+:H+ antiporter